MLLLLGGAAVMAANGLVFWLCLPRGGKPARFVGSAWEPYVAVVFATVSGFALAMLAGGAISLVG